MPVKAAFVFPKCGLHFIIRFAIEHLYQRSWDALLDVIKNRTFLTLMVLNTVQRQDI